MTRAARLISIWFLASNLAILCVHAQPGPGGNGGQSTPPMKPNTPPGSTPMPPMSSLPPPMVPTYTPPKEILGDKLEKWAERLDPRLCKDAAIRELAVRTVPLFGADAKKYIPKLVDCLRDVDLTVRLAALYVVTNNPIDDTKQQAEILQVMSERYISHEHTNVRVQAAQACMRIGPPAKRFIPNLIGESYLKNTTCYDLRKTAAEALGQVARDDTDNPIKKPDERAIIALIGALSDSCLAVRIEAAQSLMFLGPPEKDEAIAQEKKILLDRIIKETDFVLKLWLRVCFMRLDQKLITDTNLAPLAAALREKDHRHRINAADCLAVMGPAAGPKAGILRDVAMELEKSEKPEDLEMLAKSIWALGQIGKEASFAINEMKQLLNHKNELIKSLAKETIEKMEGKKKEMVVEKPSGKPGDKKPEK